MHANELKTALLALDPSGPEGFEGLLGILLGELTGQSFRLAKSGSQRGRDGDSAFDGGATYFEAKRYREGLTKNEVWAKLFEIAKDDTGLVDLWILGATCEVAAQTVEDAQKFGARIGFGVTVLDWSNNDLGALLVAVVAAATKSKSFISQGLAARGEVSLVAPALHAIDYFENHADFSVRLEVLRHSLAEDVGLGHAKTLSEQWFGRMFSNKAQARAMFGQPLCPLDPDGPQALDRPERISVTAAFSGEPKHEIYAIVGEEGVGKSWLAIQSWNQSLPKSLLVLCAAEELTGAETDDIDSFLIRRLIRQTGVSVTLQAVARWARRFQGWRANLPATSVRLTLMVDGLNQSLKSNWGRWLSQVALHLNELGGCLVVTTRTQHWKHLQQTLACDAKTIRLAEWSINDVKKILEIRQVDSSNVRMAVLESIRNPRLLGIAVELVEAKAVELLDELSVGRLLFEHMRRMQQMGAAPLCAAEFAEFLRVLAAKILTRAKAQESDDLRLFSAVRESQLEAVASSQFFSSVKGSISDFEIKLESLNLALALYLVGQLEREVRNDRDPRERLATILEPISALDQTAEVVLLAIQIACLDDETSAQIQSALIENLVMMQNLPNSEFEAFAVLVKSAPVAFLDAAENLYLSHESAVSKEWLLRALIDRRTHPGVWQQIMASTKRWLSFYSLAPERRMHSTLRSDSATKIADERHRVLREIQDRQARLTENEQSFLSSNLIVAPQAKFEGTSRLAFYLLAGMPLKEIAPYLVRWRFSHALNLSISSPYDEFEQLIRFNRMDWQETRFALLKSLESLTVEKSSMVGKWTRVGVLHATGAGEDASESERLFAELTGDQERVENWSLTEDYCTVDPCDPDSNEPENVVITAQRYREIEVGKVATSRGVSGQDHYYRGAQAGVARFLTDDALYPLRALAGDVLGRSGFERRQGVLELMRHSAGLTREHALLFLAAGVASTASCKDRNDARDEFLTAQFSTLIALPHLTAEEQLDAIVNLQSDTVLIELLDCLKTPKPEKVEQVLVQVLHSGSTHAQTAALAAVHYSRAVLTTRAAAIVRDCLYSPVRSLRHEALAIVASSVDAALLREVVDSEWRAHKPRGRDSYFEDWHGSTAILKALEAGLIAAVPALDRMNLSHYGFAAEVLPVNDLGFVADRVEVAIAKSLAYEGGLDLPDIQAGAASVLNLTPPLVSIAERAITDDNLASQMRRLSETDDELNERHVRMSDIFERFAKELTAADAELILADLTFDGIRAIIGQDAVRAQRWVQMLVTCSDSRLSHMHHVALQVAVGCKVNDCPQAQELLTRLLALQPTIRRVSGAAKISAEAIMLWSNADTQNIVKACKRRLLASRSDSEIAREVIAAHLSGKLELLQSFIDELLAVGRPYETALALMSAGFCDTNAHAAAVLSNFAGVEGFLGTVHATASGWYKKNAWAKTWYEEMLSAEQPSDFWRASVLLMKIVDGRFDVWGHVLDGASGIFKAFTPTIQREIEKRIEKVQKKRDGKLFGAKAPIALMIGSG